MTSQFSCSKILNSMIAFKCTIDYLIDYINVNARLYK